MHASVTQFDRDTAAVSIPRPTISIVVRIGPMSRGGLDAYATAKGRIFGPLL